MLQGGDLPAACGLPEGDQGFRRCSCCNARQFLLLSGSKQQVTGRGCLCATQTGIRQLTENSAGEPNRDEYRRYAPVDTANFPCSGMGMTIASACPAANTSAPASAGQAASRHVSAHTAQNASLTKHDCFKQYSTIACRVVAARVWPGYAQAHLGRRAARCCATSRRPPCFLHRCRSLSPSPAYSACRGTGLSSASAMRWSRVCGVTQL